MWVDAHIHLERYRDEEIVSLLADPMLRGVVAVSMDLESSRRTLEWKRRFPGKVKAACGFHPEQEVAEVAELVTWMEKYRAEIDAIGEIGLPYYRRREAVRRGESWEEGPYIRILEEMLRLAAEWDKPAVLHGVREDVPVILDLLDRFGVRCAHFHWIKADREALKRMAERGCFVSFTPDILYDEETRAIAASYPLELILTETDGPWPFEGPFAGRRTNPLMVLDVIRELAVLRRREEEDLKAQLLSNVEKCYGRFG
jgi:TatD DNase family protein